MHAHAVHMRQRAALGVFGVLQQGGGGGVGQSQVLRAPADQTGGFEMAEQFGLPERRVELKFGPQA